MKTNLSVLFLGSLLSGSLAADSNSSNIQEVIISSHPLSGEGLSQSSNVLSGDELKESLQGNLGATLGKIPGIHSASFGEAVGRPIIHGLGGARVRIMEDRIDAMDASVTSTDHAVGIEPFIAEQIEVLKGSATLLYGSGAIGGIVDVHTGRIPHQRTEEVSGKLEFRQSDNHHLTSGAGRLDGSAGNFGWHLDGFGRDAHDYEIPGFAESDVIREPDEEKTGEVAGSRYRTSGGAFGASWIGDRGFIGFAVSQLDANYGLPGGHAHEEAGHDDEEGTPTLDMEQTRIDLEAALRNPLPGFASLNLRLGINDYQHREIEPNDEVATRFENDAWEARIELTHQPIAEWQGVIGMQHSYRDFSAIGEESFTPPAETQTTGLFWVGQKSFAKFDLETGIRVEKVTHDPDGTSSESFTGSSASLGVVIPAAHYWQLGLLADYSIRVPVSEELYSFGPHLATRSFEIGDPNLETEKALGLSATLQGEGTHWDIAATLYATQFRDFIYQAATGTEMDELPVFMYHQDNAVFYGLDIEAATTILETSNYQLRAIGKFDTVRATLDISGNDHLPRIPATRYGVGLEYQQGGFSARLDYTFHRKQDNTAAFELPTDSNRDLAAYLGYTSNQGSKELEIFLQGRNLSDEEQRNHSSFIKDVVPLSGRTIEAGVRVNF